MVAAQERALLQSRGHQVGWLTVHNETIDGLASRCKAALNSIYSVTGKKQISDEIHRFGPEIVHVHNFFPLLSPSIYYACKAAGVPVVQSVHNFRLICPNALLFRDGAPCELCVGKAAAWPAIKYGCYRNSRAGSAAVALMLGVHKIAGTWASKVDTYIALTNFSRERLIAGGLPASRVFVKPNFISPDPGDERDADGFGLFVGRLAPEKGVKTLISAWSQLIPRRKLRVVGLGPEEQAVQNTARNADIEFLGLQPKDEVLKLMSRASFLVLPSEWYEGFPMVMVEAFAKGLPVIASRLGSLAELIDQGRTGLLFPPGDPQALAEAAEWMFTHPAELEQMSRAARQEFEAKYTAERNYEQLMQIYQHAVSNSRGARTSLSTC